jgi:hypothetical protein
VSTTPVLVAIHSDGYIEVFGERDIDVRIVNVPAVGSVRGEILAEEFIELNLPPRHRAVYAPGMIRAAKCGRKVTPQEIADVRTSLQLLRVMEPSNFAGAREAMQWVG